MKHSESNGIPEVTDRIARIRSSLGIHESTHPLTADDILRKINDFKLRAGIGEATATSGAGTELPRWQSAVERLPNQREYKLSDLLRFEDADFVENVYRAVLRRSADKDGKEYFLAKLRQGLASKVEVIGDMRWSPEGVARAVHVDGLLIPYKLNRMRRMPVLGGLVRVCHSIARLPNMLVRQQLYQASSSREIASLGVTINELGSVVENEINDSKAAISHLRASIDLISSKQQAEGERRDNLFDETTNMLRGEIEQLQAKYKALNESVDSRHRMFQDEVGRIERGIEGLRDEVQSTMKSRQVELDGVRSGIQGVLAKMQDNHESHLEALQAMRDRQQAIHDEVSLLVAKRKEKSDIEAGEGTASGFESNLYARIEDQFRGSVDLIRQRLVPYLEIVGPTMRAGGQCKAIDLGCGRGEWLKLLRDNDLRPAYGYDLNHEFVRICMEEDLHVEQVDALEGLSKHANQDASVITSFHLVEHLKFKKLVKLIDESRRVLRDGGCLILETPNPENIQVSSNWFYYDPTHRNPIPPEFLRWLVLDRGFKEATIERLSEAREFSAPEFLQAEMPGADQINKVIEGYRIAPDYAVVAWR